VQCQILLFSVVSWCAFQACLGSFWMVLRWFQLPQLLLILLLLLLFYFIYLFFFFNFTYAVFHLFFKIFLASLLTTRFFLKLQHLLTDMCLIYYYGLWCLVYCWGWFCQLSLAEYIMWFVTLLTWLVSTVFGALSYLRSCHISPLHFLYVKG
jgi:hypothetical protein